MSITHDSSSPTPRKWSNLDLINRCDDFPDSTKDPERWEELNFISFVWQYADGETICLGHVRRCVYDALAEAPESVRGAMDYDAARKQLRLLHRISTESERTELVATLTDYWRRNKTFALLNAWCNELWPAYGRDGELLFRMERCALGLLGLMRFGVHMTAFVVDKSAPHGIKIWVPRRSPTKSTYPGMLDNSVAGGLMVDEDPFECITREAGEEASIPGDVMRQHAKLVGMVSYCFLTDELTGGREAYVYPECQWVFDLEVTPAMALTLRPQDGEVESFMLCTVDEVQAQLAEGAWKLNCTLIILDFFIRKGILTPYNEPHYHEIKRRLHRQLDYPGPHRAYYAEHYATV